MEGNEHLMPALRAAIAFLEQHGYRYAIIGGISLSQWGYSRYTHDVDIKVLVPNTEYSSARAIVRTAFPEPARTHAPQNPLIVSVSIQGVTVDFLLAVPGYEEQIIERAVRRDLGGWSIQICSAEDLIIQKIVAGRERDWLDVEELLIAQHGCLDQEYIAGWLFQFAEALEQPGLLERYQQLKDGLFSSPPA
jgi:predicted nucleotidyltransferase